MLKKFQLQETTRFFMLKNIYKFLADAICNLSGFGFNGFDEFGNEKWDLVTIVDPWKVEVSGNNLITCL